MSKFLCSKYRNLTPYTPGEQPKNTDFIKLNTNESPFAPSKKAIELAGIAARDLQLYPDPECSELTALLSQKLGVSQNEILMTNGSDEILNFAFMAFCDKNTGAAFADITYGFYEVFANLNDVLYTKIPLKSDFSIDIKDYFSLSKTIFIANPNAPTGLALSPNEIEKILINNPDNVVVVDEAYVDFGAQSCVPLIKKYDNLLVCQTFSKSRSMAGARLGFGVANSKLINDLNTIKYSTNPYNINKMTAAAGIGSLQDDLYNQKNMKTIIENRRYLEDELLKLGFIFNPSSANFVFVRHNKISGEELYLKLKEKNILVRHFTLPEISDYNRITIGTKKQMQLLIKCIKEILEEIK